jgi:hypothetical protein
VLRRPTRIAVFAGAWVGSVAILLAFMAWHGVTRSGLIELGIVGVVVLGIGLLTPGAVRFSDSPS